MAKSPELTIRDATRVDLPTIVALLANDPLGRLREDPSDAATEAYETAFDAILRDAEHTILVGENDSGIVAVLQLSFLPNLTYEGGWRAQIEGVRVAERAREEGIGRTLVSNAIERARTRGCHMVQLTTDKRRPDALRFYEGLGFAATHEGLKLHLNR